MGTMKDVDTRLDAYALVFLYYVLPVIACLATISICFGACHKVADGDYDGG